MGEQAAQAPKDAAVATPAREASVEAIKSACVRSLAEARCESTPYRHWLLGGVLTEQAIDQVLDLPLTVDHMDYAVGERAVNNDKRLYFDTERRAQFPVCDDIARALQSPEVIAAVERTCGVNLDGTSLRIEFAQDLPGFWLEPHTDLGVKKFTMLLYLSREPEAADWGTTIFSDADTTFGNTPFESNHALVFIPGDDTWHGYAKRPMSGVRKSLIINYVGPEWRARHELAFPDQPVVSR